ncbi:SNF family Na+-dependent transporter [Melioribacter roseus P3M-2]|uniref:SNF family Na+-dependent transporter n=1 Tax=Melioribacter roseus (strain DSM 23840 / JCM 17771 / VKM B-2668 / P3M-2) TaxID=1191523 RepID=I6ZSG8_MELRP|nr:sodium-dependent transporter [Melioribacter roseus]AFN74969.1 SNF family Na+-dependent transporter [Melioribacter roseus P3M-2]
MNQKEFFSSRWALIISTLGIAVGTGNIWRFPRIVATNGGGSFLIPWLTFLFLWSLPLIISEFAFGKTARKSPFFAFRFFAGNKYGWMGAFVAFVSTAIMFYYSVVSGWAFYYFYSSLTGNLFDAADHLTYWNNFSSGYLPLLFHFMAIALSSAVIYRGITAGIEKVSRTLVTSLVAILFILLVRAVTLPGAIEGLKFFFTPEKEYLLDYRVWLNALTQNAWDTGAGWGLIMTYAIYMKKREDVTLNGALIGFGNNSISLLAGMIIFSTVFALGGDSPLAIISETGPANTGLTFIYLPSLFGKMSDYIWLNRIFATLFFMALSFAALTSLISMVELAARSLNDLGIERKKSILIVGLAGFLFGIPSALSIDFFINQDWVWGIALLISGAFIALAVNKYGVDKFRKNLLNNPDSDLRIGGWFNVLIKFVIPAEFIVLISWWLFSSTSWDPQWWHPFHRENLGTCLFQWGIVIILFIILNRLYNNYKKAGDY